MSCRQRYYSNKAYLSISYPAVASSDGALLASPCFVYSRRLYFFLNFVIHPSDALNHSILRSRRESRIESSIESKRKKRHANITHNANFTTDGYNARVRTKQNIIEELVEKLRAVRIL